MNLRYDDAHESRAMAQHRARKQAQAGAERSQAESDRYNGALMRRDPRLVRLLKAFSAVADDQREAFVDRAIAAGRAVNS